MAFAQLADEGKVLRASQVGVEDGLLRDVADLGLVSEEVVADVLAVLEHGANPKTTFASAKRARH